MPLTDPMRGEATGNGFAVGLNLVLIGSGAILAGALLFSAWTLPPQLVLPTVSLVALASACIVAFIAWRSRPRDRRHPTHWDIAGALTFIGMCAAILSEPDQVVPFLQVATGDN
ncbi:MAG: hypothetical protein WD207_05190 [Xanthobacteraceae bacterium]